MKIYQGTRLEEGCEVYVRGDQGDYPLALRQDLLNHSAGFEWGYGGSGPAQLALAILADFLGPSSPPKLCPYCGSAMDGWKCKETDREVCGYDGAKEGDAWRVAVEMHQDFKRDIIAKLDRTNWTLGGQTVQSWLENKAKEAKI